MSLTVGRRQFLEQLGRSGAALAAGSWLASIGYAAAAGPARAIVNQARVRSELDRRLFGSFLAQCQLSIPRHDAEQSHTDRTA